jgi:hypothetical protein
MAPAMRGWTLLACSPLAAALVVGGCGENRNYQAGFAESAALDEEGYKAAEAAKAAKSANAAKAGAATAAPKAAAPAGSVATAAPAPSTEAASTIAEGDAEPAAPSGGDGGLFESDGITPSDAGRRAVRSVVTELSLPAPPPVAEAAGDEPYQKLARDRKFDEFRRKAARYVQLKKELLPLGRKLADGTATPEERALHNRLEEAMAAEFKPLNRYLWDERWSDSDRAAMGWILFVKPD